jgi:tetratricopeptide (TPR) repeat protein
MTDKDPGLRARLRTIMWVLGGLVVLVVLLRQRAAPADRDKPPRLEQDSSASASASATAPTATGAKAFVNVPVVEPDGPVPAPVSLTGSDGSGLELISLSASAVIEDPLAFTELRLVFKNPEPRVREGRFRITLPSGATISRFAMRIGDRFQEGEVVEQQAARIAYEDFLHRRQDPALLESEAGNEFSARVFPIPANATKELIVSYSQELPRSDEPYVLPLRGLPKLGKLTIRALVSKSSSASPASSLGGQRAQHEVVEVDKSEFMPDRDFSVAHAGTASRLGLRHDNLVAARIVPLSDSGAADAISSLFVLVDTSASRALGLNEQIGALERLLATLPQSADTPITVAAFDQDVTLLFSGKLGQRGDALRKGVLTRRALGASDLDGALAWLAQALPKQRATRVLLVSDGVATAGDTGAEKLRARVKALSALGVERLDVLAVGGIRDDAMLRRLVTSGLPRDGMVLDATRPADVLARKLTRATRSGVKVEIDGAGWVWPNLLDGVQPGDELVVYADLPADKPFRVKVAGAPLALAGALASVERPLLERAWIKARIDRLSQQRDAVSDSDRDLAEALKKQAIELSVKHRVLSPFTSLLVLETEQDYARFGIERRALADILTIDGGGLALLRRAETQPVVTEVAAAPRDVAVEADKATIAAPPPPAPGGRDEEAEQKGERHSAAEQSTRELAAPQQDRAEPQAEGLGASSTGMGGGGLEQRRAARGAGAADDRAREEAAPSPAAAAPPPRSAPAPLSPPRAEVAAARRQPSVAEPKAKKTAPVEGELKAVLALLRTHDKQAALTRALAWRERDAGDVLALVALGECWETLGDQVSAARAYGSIIDLFPGRADMRRFAGERLERVKSATALALAVDSYRKAVEQRPDHPASHRLLGFGLLKQDRAREAFEALAIGARRSYPSGRFRGVERILREDLGLAAAAWIKREPALADEIRKRLSDAGGSAENAPSIRFVLNWETDANDVDFHIFDGVGGHAYYSAPHLPSGGDLYADVTTGYGPECFTIRKAKSARSFPYKLQAHYYSRGPMGYGMGKLQVIDHDGKGGLRFEEHPFVVMQDGAYVELGTVRGS